MIHQDIIDRAEGKYPNTRLPKGNHVGYYHSTECKAAIEAATHEREQHTFGFAEWCSENGWEFDGDEWSSRDDSVWATTAELFAIYMDYYLTEKIKSDACNI